MLRRSLIGLVLTAGVSGLLPAGIRAQQPVLEVIDLMDLPRELNRLETDPLLRGSWYLEFQERWQVLPESRSILKEVTAYLPRNDGVPGLQADSLHLLFSGLISRAGTDGKPLRIKEVSYEFMLMDPHHPGQGNSGFSEPDSMDAWGRNLQGMLIELVRAARHTGSYDLPEQMLSLYFHEEWTIDPQTLRIRKVVRGITPVIWQRRQTEDGDPVNEAETGLPVYYKNITTLISLRNP